MAFALVALNVNDLRQARSHLQQMGISRALAVHDPGDSAMWTKASSATALPSISGTRSYQQRLEAGQSAGEEQCRTGSDHVTSPGANPVPWSAFPALRIAGRSCPRFDLHPQHPRMQRLAQPAAGCCPEQSRCDLQVQEGKAEKADCRHSWCCFLMPRSAHRHVLNAPSAARAVNFGARWYQQQSMPVRRRRLRPARASSSSARTSRR